MDLISRVILTLSCLTIGAILLQGCQPGTTEVAKPETMEMTPETLQTECRRLINLDLINPDMAVIKFRGGHGVWIATITSTNPDDGLESTSEFGCELQEDGSVKARLFAG